MIGNPGGDDINLYMLRGDIGLNWPIARNIDGELSLGLASISLRPADIDPELSCCVKGRAFSTLEIINGELVPIFNYSVLQAPGRAYTKLHFGLGVNVSLDRGFFWLGVQGLFDENETERLSTTDAEGTRVLQLHQPDRDRRDHPGRPHLLRHRAQCLVGLAGPARGRPEGNHLPGRPGAITAETSTTSTPIRPMMAPPDDHVGFGIGINVEEKLKVDATLAEDILYTFGNLFSGPTTT